VSGNVAALFLLSYLWTTNVLSNMVHATVAGVVGTWWFVPDQASGTCSPAIADSFARASTYSFGSICLGSLVTAIVQLVYRLVRAARGSRRSSASSFLFCVLECILSFLERIVRYFNKYAMVYIGLYGYDYLTAGKMVATLFTQRGWTMVINDDLVARVIFVANLVLAAMTGAVGIALTSMSASWSQAFGDSPTIAFWLTFLVGWCMAQLLLGVVLSAVDTILVTFAEAPLEFERNHPGLHQSMVSAWRVVYPNEFSY
jgi:hypothetical protein